MCNIGSKKKSSDWKTPAAAHCEIEYERKSATIFNILNNTGDVAYFLQTEKWN